MKCDDIQNKLELFVGGELSEKQISEVEHHIKTCKSCAALVTELEAARVILKSEWHKEIANQPEIDLWPSLNAHIENNSKTTQKSKWYSTRKFGFQIAFVSAVAVLLFFILNSDFFQKSTNEQSQMANHPTEEFFEDGSYPIVEDLQMENAYYMEIKSSNPGIQIIWIIKEDSKS